MPELPIPRPELPPRQPESGPVSPEQQIEQAPSAPEQKAEEPAVDIYEGVLPAPAQVVDAAPTTPIQQQVESVMSDGLADTYRQLDPVTKQKFKSAGEQTARQISVLLQQAKVHTKKIIELLLSWLRIIPGLNKHFLEQEAKIKADQLLRLRRPNS